MKHKKLIWTILSKVIGVILFVLAVIIANYLIPIINSEVYTQVINVLNANLIFLIVIMIFFMLKDIFEILPFPFNIPYPIFNAIATVFFIYFVFSILKYINITPEVTTVIKLLEFIVYPLVFLIIIILGYIDIFSPKKKVRLKKPTRLKPKKVEKKKVKRKVKKKK